MYQPWTLCISTPKTLCTNHGHYVFIFGPTTYDLGPTTYDIRFQENAIQKQQIQYKNQNKKLVNKETLMENLKDYHPEILMTLGAGDIDTFVPKIKEMILT